MARYSNSDYTTALYPSFSIPEDSPSLRACVCCGGEVHFTPNHAYVECACRSCIYCSEKCKAKDLPSHEAICKLIKARSESIAQSASRLEERLALYGESFEDNFPENMYEFGVTEQERGLCSSFTKSYFFDRQALITLLAKEGLARRGSDGATKTNDLALDIALMQCRHLFILDKFDSFFSRTDGIGPKKDLLMNLLLFTGRYQELYDVCSFYARSGEKYFSHHSPWYRDMISSPNHTSREDITKSFFANNTLHHESFPVTALNHMFIIKQMLHERMEVLRAIDRNFLNNHDCVSLVGEYLGMEREWLVFEKDWYKRQALEILSPFARCQRTKAQFGKLFGLSPLFMGRSDYRQINDMICSGVRYIETAFGEHDDEYMSQPSTSQSNDKEQMMLEPEETLLVRVRAPSGKETPFKIKAGSPMSDIFTGFATRERLETESLRFMHLGQLIAPSETSQSRGLNDGDAIECIWQPTWEDTLRLCLFDHTMIVDDYIRPRFEAAADKLNEIAGYDAVSRNMDFLKPLGGTAPQQMPEFVFTSFVKDAMTVCHKHLFDFDDFIQFMDKCDEGEMQMHYERPYDFTYGLLAALVLERKMAQALYYMSLSNGKVDPILELLPNGSKLKRKHPPPFDQSDPFLTFPLRRFTHTLCPDIADRIQLVSRWMPDVTDVVEGLFEAGLATYGNLSQIFGHGSLVGGTIWELQRAKMKHHQRSITSMMWNECNWKEGCIQWDPKSGLKIQYLTVDERRARFVKACPIQKLLVAQMQPSIAQFQDQFHRLNDAFVDHFDFDNLRPDVWIGMYGTTSKKSLKDFDTVEEACQHFFRASTLEEAIFDCVGIPRLVILNGNEKNLWKSQWKYVGTMTQNSTAAVWRRNSKSGKSHRPCC